MNETNGWQQHKLLVLEALERSERKLDILAEGLTDLRLEVQTLKTRSGFWGAFAGIVGGAIAAALFGMLIK